MLEFWGEEQRKSLLFLKKKKQKDLAIMPNLTVTDYIRKTGMKPLIAWAVNNDRACGANWHRCRTAKD
jgi:hypothetical protein